MFSGLSIVCFAASYTVALILEVSRLFFRAPIRIAIILLFTGAGLLAQLGYLINLAQAGAAGGAPLSNWYAWCLMVAWVIAAAYLGLSLRRPQNSTGLFLLPLILALIGVAYLFRDSPSFPRAEALRGWGIVHGVALLLGVVAVILGFAAGLMYLVQSYRLKHKLPPRKGLKLPSLEWLQRFNRESLLISTCLLAIGLTAGIIFNLIQHSTDSIAIPWNDPVIWTSSVLLAWLIAATLFEFFYKPARQGRKVAYLTIANFIFLALALTFVLLGEHASQRTQSQQVDTEHKGALGWLLQEIPAASQRKSEQSTAPAAMKKVSLNPLSRKNGFEEDRP